MPTFINVIVGLEDLECVPTTVMGMAVAEIKLTCNFIVYFQRVNLDLSSMFRCDCYLGIDGEQEWTGADCSLRVCPK